MMAVQYTDYEERKAVMELCNPDHPRWNGKLTPGTDEYNAMKREYEKFKIDLELGPVGVARREVETFKEKYYAYLKTPEWKVRRDACLKYYEHRCAICYSSENIDAHHRTYEHVFNEQPNDLTALCRPCHKLYHHQMNDWLYFNTNIPY